MTIFDDLPLVQLRPQEWTDDDNDFHSDILYFRGLMDSILEAVCFGHRPEPMPVELSIELDAAVTAAQAMPTGVPNFLKLVRPWI